MRTALAGFLILACQVITALANVPTDGASREDLRYTDLIAATGKFDEIVLWEGLPHPFDSLARANELATKKHFKIEDEEFYVRPLAVDDEHKKLISDAVLKHIEFFKPLSGVKFCGGFHADYAIEWRYKGTAAAQCLFCFSCGEAMFRVGSRIEMVDQTVKGRKIFHSLLVRYRQERPLTKLSASTVPQTFGPPKVSTNPQPFDSSIPPLAPPAIQPPKRPN